MGRSKLSQTATFSVERMIVKSKSGEFGQEAATDEESAGKEYSVEDFFNAVQYGSRSHMNFVLEHNKSFADEFDSQGYTCMHWASKRGDYEILEDLYKAGVSLDTPSRCESQMQPIHWAASDGKLVSLRFFLDHRVDMNAQDANGYTPVVIATQYNQVNSVIYLVKNGADLTLNDLNGDGALHWSAYKGFEELAALHLHFLPGSLNREDLFGQTPLHLAALRGHGQVVELLMADYKADSQKRDKNGLTPLELTVKKKQVRAEWVIRRLSSANTLDLVRKLGVKRLKDCRVVQNLLFGSNEKEISAWMWRAVFFSNLVASCVSVYYATHEQMADLPVLHLVNTMVQFVWWIMFPMCLFKSPGVVQDNTAGSKRYNFSAGSDGAPTADYSYERTLELIGASDGYDGVLPNVCHTCRLQRPLRSKHCKVQRRCIHKFDHFCPFVGNTVGRDNYKYFVGLLAVHPFCYGFFLVTTIFFMLRAAVSWVFVLYLIYSTVWFLLALSLLQYHLQLITTNLTTNEQINVMRYEYLRNEFHRMHNPFDKGNAWKNLFDGLFPSSKCYYSREEVLRDLYDTREETAETQGFFEQAKVNLLV